ncbi:MAG: dihydrofolate reductase [Chromatiales bacterium]|nr:dihydrofolate reductase [Chromatiales bacterium]
MISLIVAMARNRVIGRNGGLPWHLPEDLRHFRTLTLGKPVVMGRKTCESLPRALPNRTNIAITRDAAYRAPEGFETYTSLDDALRACSAAPEIMVIGGATLYEQTLGIADRIYLTLIDSDFDGDIWFPKFDAGQWWEIDRSDHAGPAFDYSFITLQRSELPAPV